MKPPVLTKTDFVRRYAIGEFGNHSPTWDSVEAFLAEPALRDGQLYHLRNRVVGGPTWYDVPEESVEFAYYDLLNQGVQPSQLYVSAMCPTHLTTFQGEVQRGYWGLNLYYTTVAKPMREALATKTRSTRGIIASSLLQRFMCPRSYEWLLYLLDEYPDHVVEFTCLSKDWGTLPGFNTVYWEIRKY